jgi:hypothetical protein
MRTRSSTPIDPPNLIALGDLSRGATISHTADLAEQDRSTCQEEEMRRVLALQKMQASSYLPQFECTTAGCGGASAQSVDCSQASLVDC